MLKLSLALCIAVMAFGGACHACERPANHAASATAALTPLTAGSADTVLLQSTPESPDDMVVTQAEKPSAGGGCTRGGEPAQTVYLTD